MTSYRKCLIGTQNIDGQNIKCNSSRTQIIGKNIRTKYRKSNNINENVEMTNIEAKITLVGTKYRRLNGSRKDRI